VLDGQGNLVMGRVVVDVLELVAQDRDDGAPRWSPDLQRPRAGGFDSFLGIAPGVVDQSEA